MTRKQYDHALIRRAQQGDGTAKTELLARHINLVHSMVSKFTLRHHSREDLVQEGTVGLLVAIERFDLKRGVHFSTYAVPYIRSYIIEAITQCISKDKATRHAYWHGAKATEELWKAGTDPTNGEIAEHLGIDVNKLASLHAALAPPTEYADREPSYEDNAETRLVKESDFKEVSLAMDKLNIKEQKILRRYLSNKSLKAVGKDLGLTSERVRQLEKKAIRNLKRELARHNL